MIALVFIASAALVGVTAWNLWSRVFHGSSVAYGHVYTRQQQPIAFWISTICCIFGLLMGLAMASITLGLLLGFIR